MTRLIHGLVLTVIALGLLIQPDVIKSQAIEKNQTYASIPKAAGTRTLIDFHDYGTILKNVKAYVMQRYGTFKKEDGTDVTLDQSKDLQNRLGAQPGMPVNGYARDPNGEPDLRMTRPITELNNLFIADDTWRPDQGLVNKLSEDRATDKTGDTYKVFVPGAAAAPAGTTTPTGTTATTTPAAPAADIRPRDEQGGMQYMISQLDLALENWQVELNSSARTVENIAKSYTKEVFSYNEKVGTAAEAPYKKYFGFRIHFPTHKYNAYAKIGPAYDIPAFDSRGRPINYSLFDETQGDDKCKADEACVEKSYEGVMHNVQQIKNIVVRVSGRNFPHGFAIRLRDQNDEVSEYFLGYLDFAGWRLLKWENPNYVHSFTADELFRIPLYPMEIPYRVFDSFIVYRSGNHIGGDFVGYIDWVKMDFDLAVSPDELNQIDVDDDSWWYILRDQNAEKNKKLLEKYSEEIDLRMQIEARIKRKGAYPDQMVTESSTRPATAPAAGTTAPAGGTTPR